MITDPGRLMTAVGEHLEDMDAPTTQLAVCGGAALNALGLVIRTTRDVDVFALVEDGLPRCCGKMDPMLQAAVHRVARDFSLSDDWLNFQAAFADVRDLPAGIAERWVRRPYGSRLTVHYVSRFDQIHFKLHAAVDRGGPSVHFADLRKLSPTSSEIHAAAMWARRLDPSEGFVMVLKECLGALGFADVASRF